MDDLNKLSKKELEELGREYDIELDRRKSKKILIEQLSEVIAPDCVCGFTEDEDGKCDDSHSLYDLKSEYITEVQPSPPTNNVLNEVKPQSFRSLREAKKYAKENGGRVVERGRFHVL